MPPIENPRITELRRRVHADPASIAFAQLAEEYRRAGNYDEAVRYCRTGLARHPGYLSARVTLGRALIETGGLDEAQREFAVVLASASDNLAAIRGMAEIHQRRGDLAAALEYYKRALALARFDPDIEEAVTRIGREMGTGTTPASGEGLSFEQATSEFLSAAARVPAADVAPVATPAETLDFDALLASLGAPNAAPPAVMEMLLSKAPATVLAQTLMPQLPAPAVEAFADLERELQAFEQLATAPALDAAALAMLGELEAWARVLEHERLARIG